MAKSGKKLLLWFIALALVMACAPAMVTPVPPLDPNAVNLYIAQTANAAYTQTAAALPVFTATTTFTPTPRSTFTPGPTPTPFQTFIIPSPTPILRTQYFRVKHDNQLETYDYKSRTAAKDWGGSGLQTPEVVPLFVATKMTAGTNRTKVDGDWEVYINALNNKDKQKLRYLKAKNTALFNGAGFPQLESLTMGGNVVAVDALSGGWARVHTLNYLSPGPLKNVNYMTNPEVIHKFVVVGWNRDKKTTYWVNPPPGAIYWPLVSSAPVWIPLERLEPFPTLPRVVTAKVTQDIRRTPEVDGKPTGKELLEGDTIRIVDYQPSGSNVWGRLSNGTWIALLLYKDGAPQYLTDWEMETRPPPP